MKKNCIATLPPPPGPPPWSGLDRDFACNYHHYYHYHYHHYHYHHYHYSRRNPPVIFSIHVCPERVLAKPAVFFCRENGAGGLHAPVVVDEAGEVPYC
jgi:hypothetical protein